MLDNAMTVLTVCPVDSLLIHFAMNPQHDTNNDRYPVFARLVSWMFRKT